MSTKIDRDLVLLPEAAVIIFGGLIYIFLNGITLDFPSPFKVNKVLFVLRRTKIILCYMNFMNTFH